MAVSYDQYTQAQADVNLLQGRVTGYQIKVLEIQRDIQTLQADLASPNPKYTEKTLANAQKALATAQGNLDTANSELSTAQAIVNDYWNGTNKAAEEKEKTEAAKNTPPPPANSAEPTKASPTIADSDKLGDSKPAPATKTTTTSEAPNSGTTIAGKAGSNEKSSNTAKLGLRDYNPLSKFSSYTYNISLYVLEPDAYNRYMDGDRSAIKDFKLLVRSGGSNQTTNTRAKGFELDLYIDDLQIKSQITAKALGSPTTSNKEYKFKIYEPYGFSFTHKLATALNDPGLDITKTKGIFFLLIKFYGYDANGQIIYGKDIPGTSNNNSDPQSIFERGFAIAFKSLNFKLENKLVVYDIVAQDQVVNVGLGVAKATIAGNKEIAGTTVEEILLGNAANKSVKGLVDILNNDQEAQRTEKNPKIEVKNEYKIIINSDEIKKSLMIPGDSVNKEKTPFIPITSTDNVNERTAFRNKLGSIQKKIRTLGITSGQHILKVIDLAISQSTYIKDALTSIDKEQESPAIERGDDTNIPNPNPKNISWYNVVPFVKVLATGSGPNGKDAITKNFAHSITYIINKYEIPYIRSVYASKSIRYYGPHKRYKYWYTGQNSEILSYEVTFNHLYQNDVAKTSDGKIDNSNSQDTSSAIKSGINADTTGTMAGSSDIPATIKSWLYSSGDLQKFQLKILGDPDYLIPTYSIQDIETARNFYGPDFTIDPSQGQVFIEIDFNQVEDYDNATGLLKPNHDIFFANYPSDLNIKGIVYYITEVTSIFSKGKFEQTITGALPEFATIGDSNKRGKDGSQDSNQSDAETNRLLRQGNTTKNNSNGQITDSLANASRKNAAAYRASKVNPNTTAANGGGKTITTEGSQSVPAVAPKINPVTHIADDDGSTPMEKAAKAKPGISLTEQYRLLNRR